MKDQRNDGEFHRADPARRRQVQWLLAATLLLGVGGIAWLLAWMGRTHGDPAAFANALTRSLGVPCVVLALAGVALATWLFRLAAATRAERRWPPSSMRTTSDVRIRYLSSADALVAQMKGGAIELGLLSLALGALGAWLLRGG